MRLSRYFLFFCFTLLLLFYPGDSLYFHIFAYNRRLFATQSVTNYTDINPIPVVKTLTYPAISAYGAYIVDLPSFTPILEINAHQQLFPASTTKIMTALVAGEVFKPEDVITVERVIDDGQVMELKKGEKITVENLTYGILVHSANDAAYALADAYGYPAFIDLMNKKAESLGMKNSFFTNPAGLDDAQQHTTPFDLAVASRELLTDPYLRKMVGTKEIIISDVDFQTFHKLTNVNKLLGEIQGIGGLKTGYTEHAGENLVSLYKKNGHEYILIIMKSLDRFEDTRTAIKWVDENVSYIER